MELLGDLRGRQLFTTNDPERGCVVNKSFRSLLRFEDGRRIPNAGLFPALQFLAAQRGIQLRRRIAPAIVALPAPTRPECLEFLPLAQFVHRTVLGRVAMHAGIKSARVIGDLASAFPDARFVVLGEQRHQLDQLSLTLNRIGIRAVSISSRTPLPDDEHAERQAQVTCATPRESANLDFATADIVIVLDAFACTHASTQLTLSQVDARFRLYGLFDVNQRSAPSTVDAAFATFGPELIHIFAGESARREAHVAWIRTPPPTSHVNRDEPNFAARCYWHHDRRNRRICQLAIALRASEPLDAEVFGDIARPYDHIGYVPPSVTILVDRPIHAVELSHRLSNWPVIASDDAVRGMSGAFRNRVHRLRREWPTGTNQIVLTDAARNFRGETSDVIIWAGGGESIDAIPPNWLTSGNGSPQPLLIVDFRDAHNRDAKRLSENRQHAYFDHEIFPINISAAQGRLAMFLSRQATGAES